VKRSRLKPGKKTLEWERLKPKLKRAFEAAGITRCEFQYDGCWNDNALSFAHVDKRRYLKPDEITVVALACIFNCHAILERMPREQMRAAVENVIEKRICQPAPVS